jgi:hypothetical protein
MVEAFFDDRRAARWSRAKTSSCRASATSSPRAKPPRPGRNPRTGEAIPINDRQRRHLPRQPQAEGRWCRADMPTGATSSRVRRILRSETGQGNGLPRFLPSATSPSARSASCVASSRYVLRYWEQEFTQLQPDEAPRQPALLPAPRGAVGPAHPRASTTRASPSAGRETAWWSWLAGPRRRASGRTVLASGLRSVVAGSAAPVYADAPAEGEPAAAVSGEAAAPVCRARLRARGTSGRSSPASYAPNWLRIRALLEI